MGALAPAPLVSGGGSGGSFFSSIFYIKKKMPIKKCPV
jgi:hypothetical protein